MLKVIELFSGIGSQTQALKNLEIGHTSICCEYDPKIHKIYEAIHGPTPNLGDITQVASLPACDLLTYSFPCQDLSVLGNQRGLSKGTGTRSSLLWEVERLLRNSPLPKVLLLENVKQLVGPKNIDNFNLWLETLSSLGYKNSWKVLNAVDYCNPQNRERVFVVSTLEDTFEFPSVSNKPISLSYVMDTEQDVRAEFGNIHFYKNKQMRERIIKTINNTQSTNSTNRVYGRTSFIHALTTQMSHPGQFGAILYSSLLMESFPLRKSLKGLSEADISNVDLGFDINSIRLATPKEAFRLMGFSDSAYIAAKKYMVSNKINLNNFYHVAGNSIVVSVLEHIFEELFL